MSRLSNPAIPLLGIYPQKLIFKNTKVRVHGGHCSTVHNNKNSKTPPLLPTLPHPRWDPESLRVTIKGFQEFCNVGSIFPCLALYSSMMSILQTRCLHLVPQLCLALHSFPALAFLHLTEWYPLFIHLHLFILQVLVKTLFPQRHSLTTTSINYVRFLYYSLWKHPGIFSFNLL